MVEELNVVKPAPEPRPASFSYSAPMGSAHENIRDEIVGNAIRSPWALTAPPQLRTQMLTQAIARAAFAASPNAVEPAGDAALTATISQCWNACLSSISGVAAMSAIFAMVILVTLRPPFVLRFEYDARRPWKGSMKLSGMALLVAVLIVVVLVTGIPLLAEYLHMRQ